MISANELRVRQRDGRPLDRLRDWVEYVDERLKKVSDIAYQSSMIILVSPHYAEDISHRLTSLGYCVDVRDVDANPLGVCLNISW